MKRVNINWKRRAFFWQRVIKIINREKVGEYDSPFYKIIVGTPKVGDSERYGFTIEEKNKWKEYFSTKWLFSKCFCRFL